MKELGKTMVLGAGPGGIQAALDLAQAGFQVILAEASDHTGGLVSKLDVQFPTSSCGFCRMLPMADRDKGSEHCLRRGLSHENIDLRLNASLVSLEGEPGAFTASLGRTAPLVDPDKCMGCGICETVCPVEIPDLFNEGLTFRKVVSRPCPQSFPNAWAIDPKACTRCGECETACPTRAVSLSPSDRGAFKVLVVDDEAIVRDSMKEWLGLEGFGVETADSGKKALDLMERTGFHVMLTDIKMPGMDGVELLSRVKEIYPDITVVMMTAYAEVDSAVNAMKEGALDYVTKPFEPDKVIAMVDKLYGEFLEETAEKEGVDAVILATGTGFFVPDLEKNIYGYGRIPGVVTALEFERWLSPAGPGTMEGVKQIAWVQCVGSRDHTRGFCSSVCCMISVKQALLAMDHVPDLDATAVFYMDLRTPGKEFEQYKEMAMEKGVNFIRSRIHSLAPGVNGKEGPVRLRYVEADGRVFEKEFDMVVLATGQELTESNKALITTLGLETDDWGFVRSPSFAFHETSRPGIFTAGGLSGFKDIETTVTLGAAAAMSAMETMGKAGKLSLKQAAGMDRREDENQGGRDIRTEAVNIHVLVCTCSRFLGEGVDQGAVKAVEHDPVVGVGIADDLCTPEGMAEGMAQVAGTGCNRLVVAGCPACIKADQQAGMGRKLHLPVHLIKGIDLLGLAGKNGFKKTGSKLTAGLVREAGRAIADLKALSPVVPVPGPSFDRALVVGGGIAGMTAALAIAHGGFGVDLVEKGDTLGGNLSWIHQTVEGEETAMLLSGLRESVSSHERIHIHFSAGVKEASGLPGRWVTTLEEAKGGGETGRVSHGVVVLATGGREAKARETGAGIYTQKEFQLGLDRGEIHPEELDSLVMIQCRGCRQENRNYCSRVCCPRALHQAMALKEKNSGLQVYVLYRDMMTPGGLEVFYTKAREMGVIFIPYTRDGEPEILEGGTGVCRVACHDPILDMEMEIEADALVLAVGVVPVLPAALARMFTAQLDEFGFFKAADPKWRPMDALHPRVLGCGLALKPCDLALASATAKAAAARAVGILSGASQGAAARVRPAYCSLCQVCIPACPFNARALDTETATIAVDSQACQGCGICAAVCPSKAAVVEGGAHYLDVIDRILAL